MPKRSNPFEDSLSPQLKTHVREKEVNNGVCQQFRMRSVYEKTHKLLFAGMRDLQGGGVSLDANENITTQGGLGTRTEYSDPKQMHMDKDCHLVGCEESSLTDVDMDSNNCHDILPQVSVVGDSGASSALADVADSCSSDVVLSSLGSFCENPRKCSSECVPSSSLLFSDTETLDPTSNVFSHMKQAQLRKPAARQVHRTNGVCQNCRYPIGAQDILRCQFCEKNICCFCVRHCEGCLLGFCHLCSLINYDLPTERSFCLTCQGR